MKIQVRAFTIRYANKGQLQGFELLYYQSDSRLNYENCFETESSTLFSSSLHSFGLTIGMNKPSGWGQEGPDPLGYFWELVRSGVLHNVHFNYCTQASKFQSTSRCVEDSRIVHQGILRWSVYKWVSEWVSEWVCIQNVLHISLFIKYYLISLFKKPPLQTLTSR